MDYHVMHGDPAWNAEWQPWCITVTRLIDSRPGMSRETVIHTEMVTGVDTIEVNQRAIVLMQQHGGDGYYVQKPACYWVDNDGRSPARHAMDMRTPTQERRAVPQQARFRSTLRD